MWKKGERLVTAIEARERRAERSEIPKSTLKSEIGSAESALARRNPKGAVDRGDFEGVRAKGTLGLLFFSVFLPITRVEGLDFSWGVTYIDSPVN